MTFEEIRKKTRALERKLVQAELEANGWNQSATARAMGCNTNTLRRAIERHPELVEAVKALGPAAHRPKAEA